MYNKMQEHELERRRQGESAELFLHTYGTYTQDEEHNVSPFDAGMTP